MSKPLADASKFVAGIYIALGDDKGREIIGIQLKDNTDIQIRLNAKGEYAGVLVNGKRVK